MTPIVLFLFVPPLLLLALVPYTWRHRTTPGAGSFLMLVLAVAAWGICYALQLAAPPDLAVKSFWSAAKYIGIAITPVAWFAFALEYTGYGEWLTRRRFDALLIIPAITIVMAFTNPLNLMWSPLRLVTTDQFVTTDAPFGLWFWVVHAAYSYFFILAGIVLLVRTIRRFPQMYQQQAGALVVAVVLPLLANFIFIVVLPLLANFNFISRSSPLLYLDLTSVAFTFSALLFAWALFRYRLLDVVPVARDAVVASMTDVVVVIDLQNRIVDINPAGQQALGRTAADVVGQPVERVFANWSDLVQRYRDMPEVHEEITLPAVAGTGSVQSYFDLRVTPISDQHGRVTGRLVVLRDITQGRLAESLSDSEKRMRHRAAQLQTVAEVARAITSERNLSELLPLVTRLIGDRFNFYHVAIFMLDQNGEYAVLQAASSEGGQHMLAQGHRLKASQTGIVGYVAGSGLTRMVIDVSQDAEFVRNPYLPLTRSEMALPLKVREQVIGVLDVQSAQATAFTEEDVTLLATLADQVATAIENARSFERVSALAEENRRLLEISEKAVEELNALTRRLTAEGWERYFTGRRGELVVEDVMPELAATGTELADSDQDLGGTGPTPSAQATFTLPIMLRGELIGTIDLEPPVTNPNWDEDNVSIIKSVAERVGLALDNARLFEQTQIALSETEQLYNVGLHINTAATLEDLLQAAIAPSVAAGASSAGIWLFELDEAKQPSQMEFAVSWTRGGAHPLPLGTRLRVADYPSSKLWLNETGQPSFIGDIARDERADPQMRAVFQRLNIAATAFMPLTLGGRWVGIIIVSWREPHDFAAGEQRMYQSIASQVAVAIENRRLFERAEGRAQREARLNQIAQMLRRTTDIPSILRTAAEQLSLALDTSHAQAQLGAAQPIAAHRRKGEQEVTPDNAS